MKTRVMHRTLGILAASVLAMAGCGEGCCCGPDCEPPPTEDVSHPPGRLVISRPLNGATITAIDDEDALSDGIQLTVEVRSEDVPDSTQVSLVNSAGGSVTPVALSDGKAVFAGVTVVAGEPPAGLLNELTASAGNHAPDTVSLTVIGESANLCRFLSPLNNATLTEDANALLAGFQTQVQIACSGSAIPADAQVSLVVNGGAPRQATLASGLVSFADTTLIEGGNTLLAYTHNLAGTRVGDAQISVTVDTGACDAVISAPAAGTLNASVNDLDTTTPALLDLLLTVQSTRCPAGSVSVTVNAAAAGSGSLSAGSGQVQVALPQGAAAVVATVQDASHQAGASATVSYQVDTLAPEITIARPLDGAVLGAADDEEAPPNPDNGVTYTVSGSVANPEGSSLTLEVTRDGTAIAGSPFAVTVTPVTGAFARTLANLPGGDYVATLAAVDDAGNSDAATVHFGIDLSVPELSLLVVSDQDQDGVLNLAEDASPSLEHYQLDVRVVLSSVPDATLYVADVSVQPVDLSGAPTGQAIVGSQAFAATGQALVRLSLSAGGRYNVTAVARHSSGSSSLPTPDRFVTVDFVPPGLVINSPQDNAVRASRSLNLLATTAALDFAPSSPRLTINGSVSSVTPSVSAGSITYAGLSLSGASDERYTIALTIADLAGNPTTAVVHVVVDVAGPQVTLSGWASPAAATRLVALSASAGAPTPLNVATQPDLDYSAGTAGLQFGFKVVVAGESAASMGPSPQARLDVQGLSQPLFAPLVAVGQTFEAVFDGAGAGIALADGPLSFVAGATDGAGNVGSDARHALVQSGQYYVRIDSPADGAFVSSAVVDVAASGSVFDGALCELLVDATVRTSQAISGGALSYSTINLGSEGSHTLQVSCDIGGGETQDSLLHTVTVDVTPPAAPAFAFAVSDTAGHLPTGGFFNLAWASQDAVRFVRDVRVIAAASAGQCPYADPDLLTTPTSPTGTAVHYQAQGQAGARWTLAGSDCVATFADVDLGLRHDPGQQWTLRADLADLAGNPNFVETSLWVDRVAPTLTQTFPAAGVTQLGVAYDNSPISLGLQMTGPKRWAFSVGDRALAGNLALAFSGTASGTVTSQAVVGTVLISTDWLNEGPYQVTVSLSDAAGNLTVLGPVDYYVDLTAPGLEFYDRLNSKLGDVLAEYGPRQWGTAFDVNAAAGGQFDMRVIVSGVRFPFEVRLCSDNPPGGATTPCQSSGGVSGFIVAAMNHVPSGVQGLAQFTSVSMPQGVHHLYAEADDSALNHASTVPVQVTIDTYAPTLSTISVVNNVGANDAACSPAQCLGIGESPSDIVVTVSSAGDNENLAGRSVTLSSSNAGQGAIPTANLTGTAPIFTATFAGITLAQGEHQLSAAVTDLIGNTLVTTGAANPDRLVDTVAPSITAHTPTAIQQYTASTFDLTLSAADGANAVEGYVVSVHNLTTSSTLNSTIAAGNTGALFASVAMQDSATNNLSATVADRVGNVSSAYTFSYDVDSAAPVIALLDPTGNVTLSDTGSCLRTNIFRVSVSPVNRTTTTRIQLQSRAAGTSDAWGVVADSDRALVASSSDLQFTAPDPCLQPGSREVRARVYETDTLHDAVTSSVTIEVDLGVPVVTLKAMDDSTVQSGYAFLAGMDTNPAVGAYATAFTVESLNAGVGSTVRLYVNGVQVGGDQTMDASHEVSFVDVVLRDFGATGLDNTIRAEVIDGGDTGMSESFNCKADGDAPSIAFVSTVARSYLYDDDTNHASVGLQAAAGNGLAFTTTGLTTESVNATLSCTGMTPDALAQVASNAGEFVNIAGLLTSTTPYVCSLRVSDVTGNEATSPATRTLTVDIDRPALPEVVACIGEDACHGAGCTPTESYEKDDNTGAARCYVAAGFGGACGNGVDGIDDTRCSRRGTFVTLTWVAPGDNGSTGGAVSGYTISYKPMAIAASPSCSDMAGATAVDTSAMTIVAPGQQQSFTITGLGVHKDYCFEIVALDTAGNSAKGPLVLRRVPIVEGWSMAGSSGSFGAKTNFSGDIDGDGLADLVVGEYGYTTDATANRGRVIVHYSRSGATDTIITYPMGHGGSRFGWAISTGDFNGDGYADVAIAESIQTSYDRIYLYWGSATGLAQAANSSDADLPSLVPDSVIDRAGSKIGWALANRPINIDGDLNSDHRLDDLVTFGWADSVTPGTYDVPVVLVYRGRTTWPATLDAISNADMTFRLTQGSLERINILTGGDFDVDGKDDLVVPVWNVTPATTYVIYGRDPLPALLQPSDGTGANIFTLQSPSSTARYGTFATAYEGTGDLAADLAVFDNTADPRKVYFYWGMAGQKIAPVGNGSNVISIASTSGLAVDTMGDVTGDGIPDLCVGHNLGGSVQYFAGSSTIVSATADPIYQQSPNFGVWVAGGRDHDGDGEPDLAVSDSLGTGRVVILR